jgi:glycerol-3-phosphate acyltransferase PlsY
LEILSIVSIVVILLAYITGSIPTAVWVGKRFYGIDVREHGSGNAGATNTIRVLGPKAGIPVFIIDVLKGFVAVELAYICRGMIPNDENFATYKVIISMVVVIGHVFPVFAGFKGGKGIATSLGVVLALFPLPAVVCFVVFIIVLLITGYVSLGSVTVAIIFPFISIFIFNNTEYAYVFYSCIIAVFIVFMHRKNIKRLLNGQESKFSFKKKKPLVR